MRKLLLLILIAFLFFTTGCRMEEQKEVMAGLRPDKYWKEVWKVEEKETQLELTSGQAVVEAFCRVKYLGEKPAEDVWIMIGSPLTRTLIEDAPAVEYETIQPGEEVEYRLKHEVDSWQEKVPVGVSEQKLKEDFLINSYVQVGWKYGEEEYSIDFYDWKNAHP
jgi:hypothetical protein